MAARVGVGVLTLILLLAALLGTLPRTWVNLFWGNSWVLRGVLVLAVLWFTAWVRVMAIALLPRAPLLLRNRLTFPVRGKKVILPVSSIAAVHVERRPEPLHEVFVVELKDGAEHDLCPVHWDGAERLYRALKRRVR